MRLFNLLCATQDKVASLSVVYRQGLSQYRFVKPKKLISAALR